MTRFLIFLRHFSNSYELQFWLPAAAILVVLLFYLLRRAPVQQLLGRKTVVFLRGFLMAPLLAIAVLSVENYRATDYYRFDSYLNAYEFYHYYIGTKYGRELGYTNMYAASLVADAETGMKWKHDSGTIRNLQTGRHVNHKQILDNAEEYKALFTPERWEEFKRDIMYFKDNLVQFRWNGILRDKGYNGTPVWSMLVGGLLSNRISTDNPQGMMFLALLDPLLILLTFLTVIWAFGPRTALLMIVLLGSHYMMKWWHMKGAYLRTDWAMCLVMAVCFIRKGRFTAAGALTGYAMLSRIFPAVLLFGIGAKLFWSALDLGITELRRVYKKRGIDKYPAGRRYLIHTLAVLFVFALLWGLYEMISTVIPLWMGAEERNFSAFVEIIKGGAGGVSPLLHLFTLVSWPLIGALLGVAALYGFWTKRIQRGYLYFFLAFAVVVGTLTLASLVYWQGTDCAYDAEIATEEQGLASRMINRVLPGYWREYRHKIGKHSKDISTWRVGYKYIFLANFGDDFSYIEKPLKDWQPRCRGSVWFDQEQEAWWRVQLWILALTLIASVGLKDYRAYVLGFAPLFFLVSPTYYYYIMLLVPLLFFAPRIEYGRYALGLSLMYLTGMSGFWFYDMWRQNYATYYWLSVQVMVMVLLMLFLAYTESLAYFRRTARQPEATRVETND